MLRLLWSPYVHQNLGLKMLLETVVAATSRASAKHLHYLNYLAIFPSRYLYLHVERAEALGGGGELQAGGEGAAVRVCSSDVPSARPYPSGPPEGRWVWEGSQGQTTVSRKACIQQQVAESPSNLNKCGFIFLMGEAELSTCVMPQHHRQRGPQCRGPYTVAALCSRKPRRRG